MSELKSIKIGSAYSDSERFLGVLTKQTQRTLSFKAPHSKIHMRFDTIKDLEIFINKLKEVNNG
jgi:hypothetical protein